MNRLLEWSLKRIERGTLRVTYARGQTACHGSGAPSVAIRFTDEAAELALALDPALQLGELYMDGRILLEEGSCYDLIEVFKRNMRRAATPPAVAMHAMRYARSFVRRRQSVIAARRNIAHHYNLDERLYRLFLDEDMQYTCAYFEHPGQGLAQAQLAKKRHVAAKLVVEPGHRVLDIGSGWGGLALYLAQTTGAEVTGVTLSEPQFEVSERRAAERGLQERVRFQLSDYRDVQGPFDRLVSVGMFEAIGLAEFDVFFQTARRLLEHDGVFVLHSIGRTRPNPAFNPWIEKYIFPGSYIPALSEVLPAVERAGFMVSDLEVLRLHYAETLRLWRERFLARRDEARALYDERFVRMWEFYLAGSEAGFRIDRMFIFQMQLTRAQHLVPRTRDYIAAAESALRAAEQRLDVRSIDRDPARFSRESIDADPALEIQVLEE